MRSALFLFAFIPLAALGQTAAERALDLKRAELVESQARAAYEQVRELHEKGIESRFALEKAQADYERARLDAARARTALANELPAVRVVSAIKSPGPAGSARVAVTLEELEQSYDPTINRRYLVSLMNESSIISEPYQAPLTFSGRRASRATLTFRLLSDVDAVSVVVNSGSRREVIPILLQRSVSANRLQLTALNFSQEGSLGSRVEYAVTVDRFSRDANDLELAVEGLPEAFTYEWVDAASSAKLSRLRFPAAVDQVRLALRVFLPEEGNPAWFGKLLQFRAVAYGGSERSLRWGELELQLRPIGTPKLAVTVGNLLIQLAPGETRRIVIAVENTGGASAQGVSLVGDYPVGFRGEYVPVSIAELRPRGRKTIELVLTATTDALPGDYTVRLKATTASRMAAVDSPELSFRIELNDARTRMWFSFGAVLLLAGTAAVIVWLSRRLRR
jgi:hypothetical protein